MPSAKWQNEDVVNNKQIEFLWWVLFRLETIFQSEILLSPPSRRCASGKGNKQEERKTSVLNSSQSSLILLGRKFDDNVASLKPNKLVRCNCFLANNDEMLVAQAVDTPFLSVTSFVRGRDMRKKKLCAPFLFFYTATLDNKPVKTRLWKHGWCVLIIGNLNSKRHISSRILRHGWAWGFAYQCELKAKLCAFSLLFMQGGRPRACWNTLSVKCKIWTLFQSVLTHPLNLSEGCLMRG